MTDTTISFMRSLCMGEIEEDVLIPFPEINHEERETLEVVLSSVDSLLGPLENDYRVWDREGEMPEAIIEQFKEFGLFGLIVPEEEGGMGFGSAAYSRVLQQISRHDASVAVTVGAHSSIGMRGLLLFGTDEQKKRYFPLLASGEMTAAFCLTEPGAGSDAASIKTTAVRDGDHWVLNGSKLWVTNGGIASFFTVFAKTGGAEERRNMAAFIVTKDMEGVSIGPHEDKMGLRANPTTSLYLDSVRVPAANMLGPENGGFKVAMKILNSGRSGLGGGCVGGMKRLIELATRQANERIQFGRPIGEFGLVKQKIGQMVVDCYASEAVVSMVAALVDRNYEEYAVEAAISKVLATEALWRTADEALQVAGGNGYMREYPYERVLRDSRVNRIFEGTNDVLRLFIALTAMNDVGAQLKELASSLKGVFNDPIKGFGVLSDYALRRASLATGIGRTKGSFTALDAALRDEAAVFEDATSNLAAATDRILRKHGKGIIGKQFASKRLADIMIDLFALACVLSRASSSLQRNGAQAAAREIEIARILSGQVKHRVRHNFAAIDNNDDELLKSLASHALEAERFSWDTV
jgi:alkylation response protein AidB-like acyl-CoA dehydrogenase